MAHRDQLFTSQCALITAAGGVLSGPERERTTHRAATHGASGTFVVLTGTSRPNIVQKCPGSNTARPPHTFITCTHCSMRNYLASATAIGIVFRRVVMFVCLPARLRETARTIVVKISRQICNSPGMISLMFRTNDYRLSAII